jgi:hypothetical protein
MKKFTTCLRSVNLSTCASVKSPISSIQFPKAKLFPSLRTKVFFRNASTLALTATKLQLSPCSPATSWKISILMHGLAQLTWPQR